MAGDETLGLRGPGALPSRWAHLDAVFDEMTAAYSTGGSVASEDAARRIVNETLAAGDDAIALDVRGRALANLAAAAEARGDLAESMRLSDDAVRALERAEWALGDDRRSAEARVAALVNQAQTCALLGRGGQGLELLDDAADALDDAAPPLLVFALLNTRANAYLSLERYAEAEPDFSAALEVALANEPRLAVHAYSGLAAVAHATGDRETGRDRMRLVRELGADDTVALAGAEENLARMLLVQGDIDEAAELLDSAERGFARAGVPRRATGCRFGRAAALFMRGRSVDARRLAELSLAEFTDQGDVAAQVETLVLLGEIDAQSQRYADADARFLHARQLCDAQGLAVELARIDVRRAEMALAASLVTQHTAERAQRLEIALNLALPAALATDAMRTKFPPGPVREHWSRGVAAVGLAVAFRTIVALQQTRLAVELMEFVCASASIETGEPGGSGPASTLPNSRAESPFAAAYSGGYALAAGASGRPGTPGTAEASVIPIQAPSGPAQPARLAQPTHPAALAQSAPPAIPALPPRVRGFAEGSERFHLWIDEAERRYGLAIRSSEIVDAW